MAKIEKKGIVALLEEHNISKVDIIIYSVCILFLVFAFSLFFIFKNDLQNKIIERNRKSARFDTALGLKSNAEQIRTDFNSLKDQSTKLKSMFLNTNKISEFVDYVRNLAKAYRASDGLSVSPTAMSTKEERSFKMPSEVYDYFFQNGVFKNPLNTSGETVKFKITFYKKQIRVGMELTLGNLLAFLYCLEHSSKFIEVSNVNITGGDVNSIRVDMNIFAYSLNEGLQNRLKVICPGNQVLPEEEIRLTGAYPTVQPVVIERVLEKEILTYPDGKVIEIRPIFRTPGPPPPPPKAKPDDLKVEVIVNDLVGFSSNNNTYFAKPGEILKTRNKRNTVEGFPKLKVVRIDAVNNMVELDNNGIPSRLPFKKTGP